MKLCLKGKKPFSKIKSWRKAENLKKIPVSIVSHDDFRRKVEIPFSEVFYKSKVEGGGNIKNKSKKDFLLKIVPNEGNLIAQW